MIRLIYLEDVVDSIIHLIENNINGLYNLSCGKANSRLDLLELLIDKINYIDNKKINIKIKACSIDDFKLPEKYPKDVSMNSNKFSKQVLSSISLR